MRRSYDIHSLQQVSSMNTEHFELCHGCREVILPVHNIVDIGPLYHRKCFRCKQCHNLLPRKGRYKYIEKDTLEYAFCRHHAPWDVDTSMLSSKSNLQSTYSQSQISFWSLNSQVSSKEIKRPGGAWVLHINFCPQSAIVILIMKASSVFDCEQKQYF